ncbi:MAG: hypothetical protein KatS3mg114_0677 [Planctomycetaceae bacterium]|nr:MAG: hypothetical protein KatS3mg114_0677 [Planctomycetaceae bacterium]
MVVTHRFHPPGGDCVSLEDWLLSKGIRIEAYDDPINQDTCPRQLIEYLLEHHRLLKPLIKAMTLQLNQPKFTINLSKINRFEALEFCRRLRNVQWLKELQIQGEYTIQGVLADNKHARRFLSGKWEEYAVMMSIDQVLDKVRAIWETQYSSRLKAQHLHGIKVCRGGTADCRRTDADNLIKVHTCVCLIEVKSGDISDSKVRHDLKRKIDFWKVTGIPPARRFLVTWDTIKNLSNFHVVTLKEFPVVLRQQLLTELKLEA